MINLIFYGEKDMSMLDRLDAVKDKKLNDHEFSDPIYEFMSGIGSQGYRAEVGETSIKLNYFSVQPGCVYGYIATHGYVMLMSLARSARVISVILKDESIMDKLDSVLDNRNLELRDWLSLMHDVRYLSIDDRKLTFRMLLRRNGSAK